MIVDDRQRTNSEHIAILHTDIEYNVNNVSINIVMKEQEVVEDNKHENNLYEDINE